MFVKIISNLFLEAIRPKEANDPFGAVVLCSLYEVRIMIALLWVGRLLIMG